MSKKKQLKKSTSADNESAETSSLQASSSSSPFKSFTEFAPNFDLMNQTALTSAIANITVQSGEPSYTISVIPKSDKPSKSADATTSKASLSDDDELKDSFPVKLKGDKTIRVKIENVTAADLWHQYVKGLMTIIPSDLGRVEIERETEKSAEKYLEQISKLSPAASTTRNKPLQIPCFDPETQQQFSKDEKYKVEIVRATKADSELIWNTAAQLQALVLIVRSSGPVVGLEQLRKFNSAFQEAADDYLKSISSSQDRSVSRVGNFQYRVSYADQIEIYHAEVMRHLILSQLPKSVRFYTEQTKSERLKNVLHEKKQRRMRKQ